MKPPSPSRAAILANEASEIYYTKGKGRTTLTLDTIYGEAGNYPEASLGIDFRGLSGEDLKAEQIRSLPLVIRGLNLYINRAGDISKIAGNVNKSVQEAEKRIAEHEKFQKEQREIEKERNYQKAKIREANFEENKRREFEREKEKKAIEKEVEERLAADDPHKVLKISDNATQEQIDQAYNEQAILRDRESAEIEMRMANYSEEEIEETLARYDEELAEIKKAHDRIDTQEKRDLLESQRQAIKDLTKEPDDTGYIITFAPSIPGNKRKVKEFEEARKDPRLKKYLEDVKYGWGVNFDENYINNLKKGGFIPQDYSTKEANDTLNIANLVFAQIGNAKEFEKGIGGNPDLPSEVRRKFQVIANNVKFLEESNPNLSRNLYAASSFADVAITKGGVRSARNNENEIGLKFDNNALINAFEKFKIEGSKMFNEQLESFFRKSYGKAEAIRAAAAIKLKGVDAGVDAAKLASSGILKALPSGLKNIAAAILAALEKLFGSGFLSAFKGISRWISENKEAVSIFGWGATIGGIFTGSLPLITAGITTLLSVASTVGPIALVTMAGGTFYTAIGFIMATAVWAGLATIAWIVLAFILLTIFIVYIINTSGYVVPINFETGLIGQTPADCIGDPPPKPVAQGVKFSADGKYAYPVAPFQVPGYSCYHWDGNKAADIFSPTTRVPLVAYESGTIENVTLDDPLGGKYIILRGNSGRFYYYAHNCHVFVSQGQSVNAGEVISTMDETGNGRVQHSHFAINSSSFFSGGDGNVCPQEDFEDKFEFGVCTQFCYRSS